MSRRTGMGRKVRLLGKKTDAKYKRYARKSNKRVRKRRTKFWKGDDDNSSGSQ